MGDLERTKGMAYASWLVRGADKNEACPPSSTLREPDAARNDGIARKDGRTRGSSLP